jgi:methylated-DNA-[protein]-cysteine S-methyltransferase
MITESCGYTEDQVLAYVAGDLREREAAAVAEHLGECRDCCEQAAEFAALGSAVAEGCAGDVVRWNELETPLGRMYAAVTDHGLARLTWHRPSRDEFVAAMEKRFPDRLVVQDAAALAEVEVQLQEYFAGERSSFDLPVDLSSISEFERRVLQAALRIPFGEVVAYSDLAQKIGKPRASRAVGNALNHNPVAIVVPCHRVVRRDGSLGGYGGGIETKKRLLTIEGRDDLARAS